MALFKYVDHSSLKWLIDGIGSIISSLCFALGFIPQINLMFTTRSSEGTSSYSVDTCIHTYTLLHTHKHIPILKTPPIHVHTLHRLLRRGLHAGPDRLAAFYHRPRARGRREGGPGGNHALRDHRRDAGTSVCMYEHMCRVRLVPPFNESKLTPPFPHTTTTPTVPPPLPGPRRVPGSQAVGAHAGASIHPPTPSTPHPSTRPYLPTAHTAPH